MLACSAVMSGACSIALMQEHTSRRTASRALEVCSTHTQPTSDRAWQPRQCCRALLSSAGSSGCIQQQQVLAWHCRMQFLWHSVVRLQYQFILFCGPKPSRWPEHGSCRSCWRQHPHEITPEECRCSCWSRACPHPRGGHCCNCQWMTLAGSSLSAIVGMTAISLFIEHPTGRLALLRACSLSGAMCAVMRQWRANCRRRRQG